jgi:tRNA uridine 5-carboxymethylaminomethyl modification enzyme
MRKLLEATKLTSEMVDKIAACHSAERSNGEAAVPGGATERTHDWSSTVGQTLAQLLKRPQITIEELAPVLRALDPSFFERGDIRANPRESVATLSSEIRNELKSVETEIKYEGYLLQQQRAMERMKKSEQRAIPDWFNYRSVSGLSREVQEKLIHVQPRTLAQASRIPGVTPAAVSLVNVYIEIQARRREQAAAI